MQRLVRTWPRNQVHTLRAVHQHYLNQFATMSGAAETDVQAASVANSSGITSSSLKSTLTERLEAEHVDVEDISGKLLLFSCNVNTPTHTHIYTHIYSHTLFRIIQLGTNGNKC